MTHVAINDCPVCEAQYGNPRGKEREHFNEEGSTCENEEKD